MWRADGFTTTSHSDWLTMDDITSLLRSGSVHFVVADVGLPLRWVPSSESFRFWKSEVKPHLAPPELDVRLENFPKEHFYRARQWAAGEVNPPLIVLEIHH
jgi:hypothetical protein